ncbi:MAG: HEAT repeat domain-containing protein [Planctomycetota bacterium]|nr:HEAT repeat domain-containing protein [Planctomycetota bacterium]
MPPRARQVGLVLCPRCQGVMAASQRGAVVAEEPARASRPYSAADRYRSRQKLRQPQRRGVRWAVATSTVLMFVLLCWYVWPWPAGTGGDEVSQEQGIPAAVSVDVANVTPAVADKPPGDREQDRALNRLLSDLTSQDAQVCQQAISGLLQFPVQDARRSEVTNRVEKVLESGDPTTRQKVLPVLAHWHGKKTVKVLVKVVENSRDGEIRKTGIRALGSIGSAESCTALAALMDGAPTQELATLGRALRVAGSLAEDVVGQLLQHTRETVRIEACDVLRQIGGIRSLRRLSDVAQQDTSSNVRKAASHAMERIKDTSGR